MAQITLNEALAWLKTLKKRHEELIALRNDNGLVTEWLGTPVSHPLDDVEVEWIAPNGTPGIMSVTFETPQGSVRI